MIITKAKAHVIMGALRVCYDESIDGVPYPFKEHFLATLRGAEKEILQEIALEHPDVYKQYPNLMQEQ